MWANIETGSRWVDDRLRVWVVVDQVMVAEQVYVELRRNRGRKRKTVELELFSSEFMRLV